MQPKLDITNYSAPIGNVDITVMHKDRVMSKINTHNNGTVNICKYLRNALAGDYVIAERPWMIVTCSRGSGNSLMDKDNGTGAYNEKPKKSNDNDDNKSNSSACTLTFLIPSNILGGADIAGFRLYSNDKKILYAEVDLENNGIPPIKATPGINLKVNWTLIVKLV